MSNENNNLKEETIKSLQFIIVYDKVSKPAAKSLFQQVFKTYRCAVWSKEIYESNEARCTNKNKILFLVDSLIEVNLQDPGIKPQELIDGVILKIQGPVAGIYIEKSFIDELLSLPRQKWKSFLEGKANEKLGTISYVLSFPMLWGWHLITKWSAEKKARNDTLFTAIDIFLKKEMLDEFMNA